MTTVDLHYRTSLGHCPGNYGTAAPVQEVLRAILANVSLLVQFKEGRSYGGRSRLQEKWVFFLHMLYHFCVMPPYLRWVV